LRLTNAHHRPLRHSGLGVEGLAALLRLVDSRAVNNSQAKELLDALYVDGGDPAAEAHRRGMEQLTDTGELAALVDAAIAANPKAAGDFRTGKEAAIGSLVGHVKKATQGRADARAVSDLLRERLGRA